MERIAEEQEAQHWRDQKSDFTTKARRPPRFTKKNLISSRAAGAQSLFGMALRAERLLCEPLGPLCLCGENWLDPAPRPDECSPPQFSRPRSQPHISHIAALLTLCGPTWFASIVAP
jgi:hypothetical protein